MTNPIKKILQKHPVVLAPMAGVTDWAFRQIVRKFSPHNLIFTEMISAEMLVRAPEQELKKVDLLTITDSDQPIAIQIFGHNPTTIQQACKYLQTKNPVVVDINMGCPVPKIVTNQDGSALMKNFHLAKEIVEAAVSSTLPISVKLRLGWDTTSIKVIEYAHMCEQAGVCGLTIHARTRAQFYSGTADWTWIKKVKKTVSIPVIGNGDVWHEEDARSLLEKTSCNGIAVARGALGKPWFLASIEAFIQQNPKKELTLNKKLDCALEHARLLVQLKGEKKAMFEFRKHFLWYVKGLPHLKGVKDKIVTITSLQDIQQLNQEIAATCSG